MKKKGLARYLQFSCAVCLYSYAFFTSKQIDLPKKNKGGQKLYDVNVRAIYGCRQVGVGHDHLKNFAVTRICMSLCFQITTKTTDSNQLMNDILL